MAFCKRNKSISLTDQLAIFWYEWGLADIVPCYSIDAIWALTWPVFLVALSMNVKMNFIFLASISCLHIMSFQAELIHKCFWHLPCQATCPWSESYVVMWGHIKSIALTCCNCGITCFWAKILPTMYHIMHICTCIYKWACTGT